jgi:PhnB protein
MTQIISHLTFNGNCREAMMFYKKCFGGSLTFQTVGESPLSNKIPKKMKGCILQAILRKGSLVLTGSDMVGEEGLLKGNSVSLSLSCSSEEELNNYYAKLSKGGSANHPLEDTFWGARSGDLTDKFGNHWLLSFDRNIKIDKAVFEDT